MLENCKYHILDVKYLLYIVLLSRIFYLRMLEVKKKYNL